MTSQLRMNLALFITLPSLFGFNDSSLFVFPDPPDQRSSMTVLKLEKIIKNMAEYHEGEVGQLQFIIKGIRLACISDVSFNRMRIITPIVSASVLSPHHYTTMLEANFHTALDARYAIFQGMLFAAYIHPIDSLTEQEVEMAVNQVTNLALSFGTTYSGAE